MARKRKLTLTFPKGVIDDPPTPKTPKANLRGDRENVICYELVTGHITMAAKPPGEPACYDWLDDGRMVVRTYRSVGHRPRHGTDFPSVQWWNDPSWVVPDGVPREELGIARGPSMVEDGTYIEDVYGYLPTEGT